MRPLRRLLARLGGTGDLPEDFGGELANDEHVLAVAGSRDGAVVATHLGLWLPGPDGPRRVGWHLVSKATWNSGRLEVTEAEESGTAGDVVILRDLPPRRFDLESPGRLPEVVHARVTGSIKSSHHRDLPGGGAWFVQRKVPGRDGIVLQVRADRGADEIAVAEFAEEVGRRLREA
ncbi:hypothetical protein [Saccharopolyspora taberi]|uniref:Uncharacterized protein n=1 Tax=Saccharopolyspora taberi TaxID=60895 RepID=A0ABN3V737_9PSEU